jgi:hypothetical protein
VTDREHQVETGRGRRRFRRPVLGGVCAAAVAVALVGAALARSGLPGLPPALLVAGDETGSGATAATDYVRGNGTGTIVVTVPGLRPGTNWVHIKPGFVTTSAEGVPSLEIPWFALSA